MRVITRELQECSQPLRASIHDDPEGYAQGVEDELSTLDTCIQISLELLSGVSQVLHRDARRQKHFEENARALDPPRRCALESPSQRKDSETSEDCGRGRRSVRRGQLGRGDRSQSAFVPRYRFWRGGSRGFKRFNGGITSV